MNAVVPLVTGKPKGPVQVWIRVSGDQEAVEHAKRVLVLFGASTGGRPGVVRPSGAEVRRRSRRAVKRSPFVHSKSQESFELVEYRVDCVIEGGKDSSLGEGQAARTRTLRGLQWVLPGTSRSWKVLERTR